MVPINSTAYPYLVAEFGLKKVMKMSLKYPTFFMLELESVFSDYHTNNLSLFAKVNSLFDNVSKP